MRTKGVSRFTVWYKHHDGTIRKGSTHDSFVEAFQSARGWYDILPKPKTKVKIVETTTHTYELLEKGYEEVPTKVSTI